MQLKRYQIDAKLGQGGMAEVFLGKLTGIGGFSKQVVIKRLLPELRENPEFVEMFLDEARICASLNHRNIVQVFEIGEHEGLPFLAMEYLNGPTLSAVIRRQRELKQFDIVRGCRIVAAVAEALAYAHEACDANGVPLGLVHRDVTPQNILVTTDGSVKLLDFGVAKAESRMTKTRTGVMKGKGPFMAPEQIQCVEFDGRVDIFAAGVCLYLLTVGRLPFSAQAEFAVLQRIVAGQYDKPRALRPDFPPELEAIIVKALATNPAERYQKAGELQVALLAYVQKVAPISDPQGDMAGWVRALFPDWEDQQKKRIAEGRALAGAYSGLTPVSSPSGLHSTSSLSRPGGQNPSLSNPGLSRPSVVRPPMAQPGDPDDMTGVVGTQGSPTLSQVTEAPRAKLPLVVGGIALAAVGGIAALLWRPQPAATPQVVQLPAPAPARPSGEAMLDQYIPEVERLVKENRFAQARELMERAQKVEGGNPKQAMRMAELKVAVDVGVAMTAAERFAADDQKDQAIAKLKDVLELDPSHAGAQRLLASMTAPKQEDAAAQKAAPGLLDLTTNVTAQVYVDDVPRGVTPLSGLSLSAGSHEIELRRDGYLPQRQTVKITSGKTAWLNLTLSRRPSAKPAAPAVATAKASTPSPAPDPMDSAPALAPVKPAPVAAEPPESTPEPAPAPAPVPTPAVTAATPPPAVVPAAAAAEPDVVQVPRLPSVHQVRSTQELTKALSVIEKEAATRGKVPAAVVNNVSVPLAEKLIADFSPGTIVVLYPRGMYYFIVDRYRHGAKQREISEALRDAHFDGELENYQAK